MPNNSKPHSKGKSEGSAEENLPGTVHIVGAGLAGSEAAHFLAERGIKVVIHEMRPVEKTEAHHSSDFAELVCSNSLKNLNPLTAPGILKTEMTEAGSLILKTAREFAVPSGEALAVDRTLFAASITKTLTNHKDITVVKEKVSKPFEGAITLFSTGPLTAPSLTEWISTALSAKGLRSDDCYFYDAIAPIIDATSIDREIVFSANRYDKGDDEAYLNCPFTRDQYYAFMDALASAEKVTPKNFEKEKFFQGCQPIEAIAASGRESLRFGPMKPVGLVDTKNPDPKSRAYAVVQLRPENRSKTAYNLVGFQTKLKYPEQLRVFRTIPGLEKAEFLRLGSIHRNTFINAPRVLRADLSLKHYPSVYFAGQVTGVEGYLESSASGLLAAFFILQRLRQLPHSAPPANTALGALLRHVTGSDPEHYQPNNIHFGLFEPQYFSLAVGAKKDVVKDAYAKQCKEAFSEWYKHSRLQP